MKKHTEHYKFRERCDINPQNVLGCSNNLQELVKKAFSLYKTRLFVGWRKILPSGEVEKDYSWLTYEEIYNEVLCVYSALTKKLAIPPKSMMSVCSKNSVNWVVADFAIIYSGCVAGNIHFEMSRDSIVRILNTAGTVCVFCDKERTGTFLDIISSKECPSLKYLILLDDNGDGSYDPEVVYTLSDIKKFGRECLVDEPVYSSPPDICHVIFTSGSTGQPKGVSTTHKNFIDIITAPINYDPYVYFNNCNIIIYLY